MSDVATDTESGTRRLRWYVAGFGLTFLLVFISCLPILHHPQLEADEYRYLANIQALDTDPDFSFRDACMVENKWDSLWWVVPRATVRYFRPIVFTSFYLNGDLSDGCLPLAWMNLGLHAVCCWLVLMLVYRVVGVGLPALLAGLFFAAMSCHGEALWYFSGRNATLAALGFLAALLCHVHGRKFLALIPFLFALFAKESTVALPVVCLLFDLWCRGKSASLRATVRADRGLYVLYFAVVVTWLAIRRMLAGPMPAGDLHPYLILPWSEHFLSHLATQFMSYAQNIGAGAPTQPFMTWEEFYFVPHAFSLFAVAVVLMLAVLRRDRRFAWAIALGFLTWVPTSFVYISERYIYMPSIAWSVAIGLLLARILPVKGIPIRKRVVPATIGVGLAVGLIGLNFAELYEKNSKLSELRVTTAITSKLGEAMPTLPPGKTPVFLHFPGDWLQAQFLEAQLRVRFGSNDLRVHVLSGQTSAVASVKPEDDHTIVVRSEFKWIEPKTILPCVDLSPGTKYSIPGMTVEILEGDGKSAWAVRYRFEQPLRELLILQFHPPLYAAPVQQWIEGGRFEILKTD